MKCKYCGVELPEDFRKYEHIKICENATQKQREYLAGKQIELPEPKDEDPTPDYHPVPGEEFADNY